MPPTIFHKTRPTCQKTNQKSDHTSKLPQTTKNIRSRSHFLNALLSISQHNSNKSQTIFYHISTFHNISF